MADKGKSLSRQVSELAARMDKLEAKLSTATRTPVERGGASEIERC